MRVHLGGDHAAHDLLLDLVAFLREQGHDVTNHGPHEYDALDDYPVFVLRAAEAVAADPGSFGVVLGGSGNGEQMAANKVTGIRAAPAHAEVHRWRYAQTTKPLGQSHLWDEATGLGACGDWCLGHRLEDAFISGLELALAIA